jgi:hypothetical protein
MAHRTLVQSKGHGWLDQSMEETMPETGTHIVRVTLQDEPTIYREIEIESRKALSDWVRRSRKPVTRRF